MLLLCSVQTPPQRQTQSTSSGGYHWQQLNCLGAAEFPIRYTLLCLVCSFCQTPLTYASAAVYQGLGWTFNQDMTECLGLQSSANTTWCLLAHYSALPAVVHIGVSYDLPDSSDYPCKLHTLQQVDNCRAAAMYALLLAAQHTNTAFWLACLNSSAHKVYCCYDEQHRLS